VTGFVVTEKLPPCSGKADTLEVVPAAARFNEMSKSDCGSRLPLTAEAMTVLDRRWDYWILSRADGALKAPFCAGDNPRARTHKTPPVNADRNLWQEYRRPETKMEEEEGLRRSSAQYAEK